MATDWPAADIFAASEQLRTRTTCAHALVTEMLQRIDGLDGRLHSYAEVLRDSALAEAVAADEEIAAGRWRGRLHGVPVAVKDLVDVAGAVTAAGTTMLAGNRAAADAEVVRRLRAAGAIILGKLTLSEAASGNHHPAIAAPVNPWDPTCSSGFSSSGSGVAVAARLCLGALGTDTGGSIRIPSSLNGVTGLKPTRGRVSAQGVFPLISYLDVVGPMARTARDVAIILQAIAGHDPQDPASLARPVPDYLAALAEGAAGLRVGWDRDAIHRDADPSVAEAVFTAAEVLAAAGAVLVPLRYPTIDFEKLFTLVATGIASAHAGLFARCRDQYGPSLRARIERAQAVTGVQVAGAVASVFEMQARFANLFAGLDALLVPAVGVAPPSCGVLEDLLASNDPQSRKGLAYTLPFNFTGQPTLTLPGGRLAGRPVGVQLAGAPFGEAQLLRLGHAYQQRTGWHLDRPPGI